jgi:hypothetical protein
LSDGHLSPEARPGSSLPPGRLRAAAGERTFEVIPVATGFLFGFSLMSVSIPMFAARVRVMTRIETVSFGAMLVVGSPILSCRVGLHAAVSPACQPRQIQITLDSRDAEPQASLLRVHKQRACRFTLEIENS